MENTQIIFLIVSASVSFGIGRVVVHFLAKKRRREAEREAGLQAQARRNRPPEALATNKAKRRRQILQQGRQRNGD